MADVPTTLALVTLAQSFRGDVVRQINRKVQALKMVRIVAGEGVERIFPTNTPSIAKLVVKRHGKVRRAKLYYLRDRVGKATRLVERRVVKAKAVESTPVAAAPQEVATES